MKKFPKLILPYIFLVIVLVILVALPGMLHAQGIGDDCDYQDPDVPCPIDGGVWLLLAIALIYGFIQWRNINRRKLQKINR